MLSKQFQAILLLLVAVCVMVLSNQQVCSAQDLDFLDEIVPEVTPAEIYAGMEDFSGDYSAMPTGPAPMMMMPTGESFVPRPALHLPATPPPMLMDNIRMPNNKASLAETPRFMETKETVHANSKSDGEEEDSRHVNLNQMDMELGNIDVPEIESLDSSVFKNRNTPSIDLTQKTSSDMDVNAEAALTAFENTDIERSLKAAEAATSGSFDSQSSDTSSSANTEFDGGNTHFNFKKRSTNSELTAALAAAAAQKLATASEDPCAKFCSKPDGWTTLSCQGCIFRGLINGYVARRGSSLQRHDPIIMGQRKCKVYQGSHANTFDASDFPFCFLDQVMRTSKN